MIKSPPMKILDPQFKLKSKRCFLKFRLIFAETIRTWGPVQTDLLVNAITLGLGAVRIGHTRKAQYKDVYTRAIEIPQRTHIFKAYCCLKGHNVHLKLASPISGYNSTHFWLRRRYRYHEDVSVNGT